MKLNKDIRQLLQAYADDTLSAEERFTLEKEALDDNFLFECIEGLSGHRYKEESLLSRLDEVADKEKGEAIVRRIIPYRWMAGVAASILLIGAVSFFFIDSPITGDNTIEMAMAEDIPLPGIDETNRPEEKSKESISIDTDIDSQDPKEEKKNISSVNTESNPDVEKPKIEIKEVLPTASAQNANRTFAPQNNVADLSSVVADEEDDLPTSSKFEPQSLTIPSAEKEKGPTTLNFKEANEGNSKLITPPLPREHTMALISHLKDIHRDGNLSEEDNFSTVLSVDGEGKIIHSAHLDGCKKCFLKVKDKLIDFTFDSMHPNDRGKSYIFRYKSK